MKKVLIVDDSISVRKALERILKPKGVEVLSADSAKVALDILEQQQPALIIADIVMPEMDGYEFCELLKRHERLEHLRNIPVLLISGIVNPEVKSKAKDVKAIGIVKKPFKPDTLLYIVSLIFERLKSQGTPEQADAAVEDAEATTQTSEQPAVVEQPVAVEQLEEANPTDLDVAVTQVAAPEATSEATSEVNAILDSIEDVDSLDFNTVESKTEELDKIQPEEIDPVQLLSEQNNLDELAAVQAVAQNTVESDSIESMDFDSGETTSAELNSLESIEFGTEEFGTGGLGSQSFGAEASGSDSSESDSFGTDSFGTYDFGADSFGTTDFDTVQPDVLPVDLTQSNPAQLGITDSIAAESNSLESLAFASTELGTEVSGLEPTQEPNLPPLLSTPPTTDILNTTALQATSTAFDTNHLTEAAQRFSEKVNVGNLWILDNQAQTLVHLGSERNKIDTDLGLYFEAFFRTADNFANIMAYSPMNSILLEYPETCYLLVKVNNDLLMVLDFQDMTALSMLRFMLRKELPELAAELEAVPA